MKQPRRHLRKCVQVPELLEYERTVSRKSAQQSTIVALIDTASRLPAAYRGSH